MVSAQTLEEFYRKNKDEIYKVIRYIVKGRSEEDLKDYYQMLYIYLDRYKTIEGYKPCYGRFDTYMYNCIRNFIIPIMNRENRVYKGLQPMSTVKVGDSIVDALERVQANAHTMSTSNKTVSFAADLSLRCSGSALVSDREEKTDSEVKDFLKYLKRASASPDSKAKMRKVVQWSVEGYTGTDISKFLGLSAMSVSNIRKNIAVHYKRYKSLHEA